MEKKRKPEPKDLALLDYLDRKARGGGGRRKCRCGNSSLRCTCPQTESDWVWIKEGMIYMFYLIVLVAIGSGITFLHDNAEKKRKEKEQKEEKIGLIYPILLNHPDKLLV